MQPNNQNVDLMRTIRPPARATQQRAKASKLVAVMIVLDCTGSMEDVIEGVIRALIRFTELFWEADLQPLLGLVRFRDELAGEPTLVTPLGTDPEEIRELLRSTVADGGGDDPESSLPAISKGIDGMNGATPEAKKILIHVTDDQPHDPESGHTGKSILAKLHQNRVTYFGCTPVTEPYMDFANKTGGTLFPLTPNIDAEAFKDVLLAVAHQTIRTIRRDGPVLTDDALNALRDMGLTQK